MKRSTVLVVTILLALLFTACAPAAPQVVEKEKIVTVVVEKEVVVEKKVVETVVVEKEVIVEKESTAPQILRFGLDGEPTSLDVAVSAEGLARLVSFNAYETLIEYTFDDEMKVVGRLAEDYGWEDELTWSFKLHEGVNFHNGREMVAEDVKNSIDRIRDPEVASPYASYVDAVDSVEVTGKYTGLIHLKTPYAGLESYGLQMIPITPKEEWDNLKTHPVGTGPFVFKEWVMGEKVVFVKNPDYWREGLPYLDELTFQFFPQYQTLLQSLRAGDTDAVHWLDNADAAPLKREGELDVFGMTFPGFFYLGFNVNIPPFDNKLVRQAAMYAVDKDAVLQAAQFGYGDTGDINIDKSNFFYMDDFEYERDIEKAKELLAEAGFPDGVEGELIAPDTPTERPIAESVAWSLSKAGINLTPRILKVPEFINIVFTNHEAGALICGYAAPRDPDYFNWSYLYSEGSYNLWDYVNPEMDEQLEITHTNTDPNVRKDAYREVYKIVMEDVPLVFLIQEYRFLAKHPYVKGWASNASQFHYFGEARIAE